MEIITPALPDRLVVTSNEFKTCESSRSATKCHVNSLIWLWLNKKGLPVCLYIPSAELILISKEIGISWWVYMKNERKVSAKFKLLYMAAVCHFQCIEEEFSGWSRFAALFAFKTSSHLENYQIRVARHVKPPRKAFLENPVAWCSRVLLQAPWSWLVQPGGGFEET